jgi:hypothetical protein
VRGHFLGAIRKRRFEARRAQLRAIPLNDQIVLCAERQEAIAETLWDAAKLIGKGVATHIAPTATRTIGNVVSALRKTKKKKAKRIKMPKPQSAAMLKPVHDTSPTKIDRHSFNAAMKNAGNNLHKIKL